MGRWFLVGLALSLAACATVEQGPPVDIAAMTTPDMVKKPAPASTRPAGLPVPRPSTGLRMWVPRQVSPNGDTVQGHYVELGAQDPAQTVVPYAKHIPRAPRGRARISQPAGEQAPQAPASAEPPPLPEIAPHLSQTGPTAPYPPQPFLGLNVPGMPGGNYAP